MRILSLIAFVMTALGSMGASAQTMGGIPAQGGGETSAQRAAQKASCERDARLIYRNGRDISEQWLQQVRTTRRAYVQECMTKAGFAP
ncbi:hypothetical protein AA309_25900 [Microvirga vignae]|uniref:Uncharacterized protein n=1 Tax=Microvirga vignae TaxID=1225564 RepID=A0A0H1R6G7_9HYPH|nr:hypothetical protein [Microvirga vignae]KLK90391.1 hypothetical protein AA309_25900 [Microvirga vignae]